MSSRFCNTHVTKQKKKKNALHWSDKHNLTTNQLCGFVLVEMLKLIYESQSDAIWVLKCEKILLILSCYQYHTQNAWLLI